MKLFQFKFCLLLFFLFQSSFLAAYNLTIEEDEFSFFIYQLENENVFNLPIKRLLLFEVEITNKSSQNLYIDFQNSDLECICDPEVIIRVLASSYLAVAGELLGFISLPLGLEVIKYRKKKLGTGLLAVGGLFISSSIMLKEKFIYITRNKFKTILDENLINKQSQLKPNETIKKIVCLFKGFSQNIEIDIKTIKIALEQYLEINITRKLENSCN